MFLVHPEGPGAPFFMKKFSGFYTVLILGFGLIITGCNVGSDSRSEAVLIQKLHSPNWRRANGAINDLIHWHPNSTNAIPPLKVLLHHNTFPPDPVPANMPTDFLARKAARALAAYHADMSADDMRVIYKFLESPDVETRMDGLKALRGGFNAPDAVPHILPLLKDPNEHVVRDACRTLTVIGDKSAIPSLEPLLSNPRSDVRWDARRAIDALNSK